MSEPETSVESFDYEALDEETRQFVQQKADEIHGQLKRTAEGVIRIGQNLLDVKKRLGHGHFLSWLQTEFAMNPRSAHRFMNVAEKFMGKFDIMSNLPMTILYELAAPSTSEMIVEGVLSGEIPPTLQAVREAKQAEQQALADKEALQHLLQQERSTTSAQMTELTTEIEHLQQKMASLASPQIKEVPVVPEEMVQQMNTLRSRVQTLTHQRDTLSKRVEELGGQVQAMSVKREEEDGTRRRRLAWQTTANAFHGAVLKLFSGWPAPLDTSSFEPDDWDRVTHILTLCRRVIEEGERLRLDPNTRTIESYLCPE